MTDAEIGKGPYFVRFPSTISCGQVDEAYEKMPKGGKLLYIFQWGCSGDSHKEMKAHIEAKNGIAVFEKE